VTTHLQLSRGLAVVRAEREIYLCGGVLCPHYQGQRGLLPGADSMHCALVGHEVDRTCQAYYVEMAELLDSGRRSIWDRLDEAIQFEAQVTAAAAGVGAA
jgi:hypothetical protein